MKINLKLIIIGIIALFVLSACSGSGRGGDRGTSLTDYRVGTQGMIVEFQPNSPPSVVFAEDNSFPVTVNIMNKGVYPGENDPGITADLYFVGFDVGLIPGLDVVEPVDFESEEAKTRFNPEGGINIVSVDADIDSGYFESSNVDTYTTDLRAVLCYPYKTFATIDVCIDPNPNRDSNLDACNPGTTSGGSQGAPVAVTSVESIAQKGKARFIIDIQNVGNGRVLRTGSRGFCIDPEIEREDLDKITIINAELSNGISLDCTPSGDITLNNGRATISCKADGLDENRPAFNTILQMEIEYDYKTSAQRSVRILGE